MPFVGAIFWALQNLLQGRRRSASLVVLVLAGWAISLVKAYILFPFAAAGGLAYFWHRSLNAKGSVALATKPAYVVLGIAGSVVAVILLGRVFPRFSISNFAAEAASLQDTRVRGGSYYSISGGDSVAGQLAVAPLAILSAFFRPLPFEARNPMMLAAAAETGVMTFFLVRAIARSGAARVWKLLIGSPMLVFCLVFSLLFGLGVGLGSTNLGTLSRYRVPMIPFYSLVVIGLAYGGVTVSTRTAKEPEIRQPARRLQKFPGPPLPAWRRRARLRADQLASKRGRISTPTPAPADHA